MKSQHIFSAIVWIGMLAVLGTWPKAALATRARQDARRPATQRDKAAARNYFTDVSLVDQDGNSRRLYSDLLEGKVVVINTFYTDCPNACPVLIQKVAKIQEAMGDRMGKDVHLLSISLDPTNDTPTKLKAYAERFQAKPGWYFLTGKKRNVEIALRKLGQYVDAKETHFNILIIGNEPTGLWKKAFGLVGAGKLIKIVQGVLNDK